MCEKETFVMMMPMYDKDGLHDGDGLYLRLVCPTCYEWYLKLEKGMEKEQARAEGKTE